MGQDRNKNVVVLTPIEDSPAEEADLKTGDIITKVDGEDSQGKDLTIVSNRIKGAAGTKVELEIFRDGETFTKTIERRKVILNPIKSEVLEGNIRIYKTNII
jgi:carboxyl-terminal processing protease